MADSFKANLWNELVLQHEFSGTVPLSERPTQRAYRDGLMRAYALLTGETRDAIGEELDAACIARAEQRDAESEKAT